MTKTDSENVAQSRKGGGKVVVKMMMITIVQITHHPMIAIVPLVVQMKMMKRWIGIQTPIIVMMKRGK